MYLSSCTVVHRDLSLLFLSFLVSLQCSEEGVWKVVEEDSGDRQNLS